MSSFAPVIETAKNYVSWDPNLETRNEIADLIEKNDVDQLTHLLNNRVQFGTAGLRAAMGAGYSKMNELVVLQTCQGLVKYLEETDPNCKSKGIVIGYDHRKLSTLSSRSFARISTSVFINAGFKVYALENFVATPFVPFAIAHYGCAAGIMVTASHNPKADNGYKVYWGNGAQIIPPHDSNIAASINKNLQPWLTYDYSDEYVLSHPLTHEVTEETANAYFTSITKLATRLEKNSACPLRIAYTAMHGVGTQWIVRAFEHFHHLPLHVVECQRDPDPTFPTVSFPNPEEKGALNEAMKFADLHDCTLIIANDPDADRLAVAEKTPTGWKAFTGNEIGTMLGFWQMQKWRETEGDKDAAVLASIVSSRMLKKVATTDGFKYYDTLTGFKWLGNRAIELRSSGLPAIFLYEEALGFCVGNSQCDKDGISAGSVFVEMAGALHEGWLGESYRTPAGLLQYLKGKYGEFVSYNGYVLSYDPKKTDEIFAHLRASGPTGSYWSECLGEAIVSIQDITKGYDSTSADHKSTLPMTPDSHMIMFEFANGVSATLRTSGTEPKIKYYTEIAGQPGQSTEELRSKLVTFVNGMIDAMLQPAKNGLTVPK